MSRTGTTRGLLRRPPESRRNGSFAIRAPQRTNSSSGLHQLKEFAPKRKKEAWQEDAFTYYESLPPVGYVLDHTATTVAGCALRLVEDDPTRGKVPTEDKVAQEAHRNLVGPRGGEGEILRRGALLLQICGEAYLVGVPVEGEAEAIFWEFLSPYEILVPEAPGQPYRRNADGGGGAKADLDENTYVARMWRSDAKHSERAHCGLRRCLDACREMTLLQQMVEAIISSRLPMGLLLVPDDMTWSSPLHRIDETAGGSDDSVDDELGSDFMDDLLQHMGAPLRDYSSAASLVPIVVSANAEDLGAVKVIELARNLDTYAAGLRTEIIGRLALGLDVPPEVLQGKSMLNHWSAYNVDSDFLFKHVVPVGNILADFLTYAYLRPLLEIGGMSVEDAARFSFLFDPSPLATRQNDDEKAITLWEQGVVSTEFMLAKQGWDPEEAMPDDAERARRYAERILMASAGALHLTDAGFKGAQLDPKWFEIMAVAIAEAQSKLQAAGGGPGGPDGAPGGPGGGFPGAPPTQAPGGQGGPGDGGGGDGGNPPPDPATNGQANGKADGEGPTGRSQADTGQPPKTQPKGPGETRPPARNPAPKPVSAAAADTESLLLVHRLAARADAARDRVLERLGNRALPALKKNPVCAQRLAAKRPIDVLSSTSPRELSDAGVQPLQLMMGEWADFEAVARGWLRDHLAEHRGYTPIEADEAARVGTERLVEGLQAFTVEHLHAMPMRIGASPYKIPLDLVAEAVYAAEMTPAGVGGA